MECLKLFNRLWKSKRSFVLLHLLSFFLCIFMFLSCSLGIKAEEIDPTPTPTTAPFSGTFYISTEDFIQQMWDSMWPTVSAPFIIANKSFATAQEYLQWLSTLGEPEPWVQHPNVTIHSTHPPTGNIPLDVQQSTSVDIPTPVQNSIIQFIQYQVAQNPVGYEQCYIYSYNFLDPASVSTYQMYVSLKQYIKQQSGKWVLVAPRFVNNGVATEVIIYTIDLNQDVGLVGTVNNGIFNSVTAYINWQYIGSTLSVYRMTSDGQIVGPTNFNAPYSFSNGNSVNSTSPYKWTMFSPNEKNELVYVFNTLNAYKNYNSGMPQPYYLTSEGMENPSWAVNGNGSINTGTMNNSGNYYSTVTNGVGANWTPEQILALVDKVSNNGSSSGSGSSSDDDDNKKSKMWERIGNAIGNLIDGVVDVITSVVEKLTDAILSIIHLLTGYTDDSGTYHEGLLGKLTSLISVDFNGFLTSVFSWLPPEIVTLFTATLLFAVFFAIWKMIRG